MTSQRSACKAKCKAAELTAQVVKSVTTSAPSETAKNISPASATSPVNPMSSSSESAEGKTGMSLGVKIGIAAGAVLALGLVGYLVLKK